MSVLAPTSMRTARNASALALVAILAAIVALWPLAGVFPRSVIWLAALLLLTLFVAVAGFGLTGLWRGALIDDRNLMTLSRLQLIIWTALGLSAFVAAILTNIARGATDALAVAIPAELWVLMGISTTTLVGSPLLLSAKASQRPSAMPPAFAAVSPSDFAARGVLLIRKDPKDASWTDLLSGEELGNARYLDVAKLQMLFFTLILALTYAADLFSRFAGASAAITELPAFTEGALALLGISQAGYLASKATPHTP
jgi:hypothetical protein